MQTKPIINFLADTWWYGLSQRLSEEDFKSLAQLRAKQGFSAIQLVVGVPPAVGPENDNTKSLVGFPWNLRGAFNQDYLRLARERIGYLNSLGLTAIVYGAWGYQIKWLGRDGMLKWWRQIIRALDSLDVIYCLTGEVDLWIGEEFKLLPDRSTDDFVIRSYNIPRRILRKIRRIIRRITTKHQTRKRQSDWSFILAEVSRLTERSLLIHKTTCLSQAGLEFISNPDLLSAYTIQTGHSPKSRKDIWELPCRFLRENPNRRLINLEPWYEGIMGRFWLIDQLFAYWVSVLAGAAAYCYGAQGIWNVGDGNFLANWGKQTFEQAVALDTPRLIGLSHRQFRKQGGFKGEVFCKTKGGHLITIGKRHGHKLIQFFPDVSKAKHVPKGKIWLPLKGTFTESLPKRGQVVIFSD